MRIYRTLLRIIQTAVFLALIIIISGVLKSPFLAGSGGSTNGVDEKASQQAEALTNKKIVALGDSFTLGYPLGAESSWTKTLADILQVEVINKGKSQQTGKELLARFDEDVLAENPGRVIIFAGNGDAIQKVSLTDFQDYIQALVDKSRANNIIPVLALPVWYPGYEQTIKSMREWETGYALSLDILVLDFNDTLFDSEKKYLNGLSVDGEYPNAKGYKDMGEYAARVLK
ncbi:MAG: GDSL-type esterase/lipase family protein [Desulfitobacteriaceae bacterium]|nr:GDSL-type esterase/lipase family protein [Desulfitobacteriaceae bacterium]